MPIFPYGTLGFHRHLDALDEQFGCMPYAVGFGKALGDKPRILNNAVRCEAEFLFHYTTRGIGKFHDRATHSEAFVPAGSAFLVPIPSETGYENIPPDDWETMWVFFNGHLAQQLVISLLKQNGGSYIFTQSADGPSMQALYKLFQLRLHDDLHPATASGILYEMLSGLFCPEEEPLPPEIQKTCRFINQELSNPDLNVALCAEHIKMSRSHFSRTFTRYMHCNPNTYINTLRMQKATDLILSHQYKMKDIAALLGFTEPAYFNAVFKKHYGYPPGQIAKPV